MRANFAPMKILIDSDHALHKVTELMRSQRKPFYVDITDAKPVRSKNQNGYYWAVIVKMIGDEIGEILPENTHKMLAGQVLGYDTVTVKEFDFEHWRAFKEVEYRVPKSTSLLSTAEFEDYALRCRVFANEFLGLSIPLPNEVTV
jgi:hypothetical protein